MNDNLMERMITDRLPYLGKREVHAFLLIKVFKCGRGTLDPIASLDEIKKAFINKESVITVFFDIEKAYDMLWEEGLLIKLGKMSIKGRMYNWIKGLTGRSIRVRVGGVIRAV